MKDSDIWKYGKNLLDALPRQLRERIFQQVHPPLVSFALWREDNVQSKKFRRNSKDRIYRRCGLEASDLKDLETLAHEIDQIGNDWDVGLVTAIFDYPYHLIPKALRPSPVDSAKKFVEIVREIEIIIPIIQQLRAEWNIEVLAHQREQEVLAEQRLELERQRVEVELQRALSIFTNECLTDLNSRAYLKSRDISATQALQESMEAKEFKWSNDSRVTFNTFIDTILQDYFSPYISYFSAPIVINFEDSKRVQFKAIITCRGLKSHSYTIIQDRNLVNSSPFPSYFSPSGVGRILKEFVLKNRLSITSANSTRENSFDPLDNRLMEFLAIPTAHELVESFFGFPEFFDYFQTGECAACGRPLSHPVSMLLGKGNVHGDHDYKWKENHASRIAKEIHASLRSGEIYKVDSPLIASRALSIWPGRTHDFGRRQTLTDRAEPTLDEIVQRTSQFITEIGSSHHRRK